MKLWHYSCCRLKQMETSRGTRCQSINQVWLLLLPACPYSLEMPLACAEASIFV